MGGRRRRAGALIPAGGPRAIGALLAAAALLGAGALMAAGAEPPLRAQMWLAPGVEAAQVLGSAPGECLRPPADSQAALAVEIGRAAFRTPVLLGGPAARAGLSCESCHRGGRTNPDFLFPGVSGPPGTADVTSSIFSSHRGDGVDNPRPIPDLSAPKARLKIDQAPQARAVEPFIEGLIVEEFDGPRPAPAVLAGLAAYVRALDPAACPAAERAPVTAGALMADARRALAAARGALAGGDPATALTMVAGARARLGLIDERYAAPELAAPRAALRRADVGLAAIAEGLREDRPGADAALAGWLARSASLEAALTRAEPRSLFNPRLLSAATHAALPAKAS